MSYQMKRLSDYRCNPANPREIRKSDFEKLTKSLAEFKKMLALRPIVHDENNVILGGNMRFQALQKLGYEEVPDAWLWSSADILETEEEKCEFVIKDNGQFGGFDFDALANDWSDLPLADWGVPIPPEWGDVPDDNKDINEDELAETENECPKCGFKW